MRVAIDARAIGPHFPGIGRATLGLLHGLCELEHQLEIAVIFRSEQRELLERSGITRDARFKLAEADAGPLAFPQQWQIPRLARALAPTVWHAPFYFRPFWGLPRTVVTIADVIGRAGTWAAPEMLGAQGTWRGRLFWELAMRLSLHSAAHVITHSQDARRALQAAYRLPASKVSVLPHATDERFQPQAPLIVESLRQRYALPERYVLYLGSNKPHKNLIVLIETWGDLIHGEGLQNELAGTCLVLAGREDPRYRTARARAVELGLQSSVRFLPEVMDDDLPALYSGALFFVFPSLHEGFGLPPLEAMACGTPVLASNRTSLPEVIGDAGLLVEPEPGELARGMRRLLSEPALRQELRERGLRRAAQFSWRRTAAETLQIYRQVAG